MALNIQESALRYHSSSQTVHATLTNGKWLTEPPRRINVASNRVIDEYVKAGKIGGVALSEVNSNTI